MFAVAAPIGSVRAAARGAPCPPPLARARRREGKKDVDWDAKTKELTAERVLEQCMEAMADGDEDRLEACLLELEDPRGNQGGGGRGVREHGRRILEERSLLKSRPRACWTTA